MKGQKIVRTKTIGRRLATLAAAFGLLLAIGVPAAFAGGYWWEYVSGCGWAKEVTAKTTGNGVVIAATPNANETVDFGDAEKYVRVHDPSAKEGTTAGRAYGPAGMSGNGFCAFS